MKTASLDKSTRVSPLRNAQFLGNGGDIPARSKAEMAPILPLTSLIDAFSIIVIYLLIGTQSAGTEVKVSDKILLPAAESGLSLEKETPVVRIEKGLYFVNDEQVPATRLGEKLNEVRKALGSESPEILIQADQKMDYADLDPLLRAGSAAGIQKLKFAVVPAQ